MVYRLGQSAFRSGRRFRGPPCRLRTEFGISPIPGSAPDSAFSISPRCRTELGIPSNALPASGRLHAAVCKHGELLHTGRQVQITRACRTKPLDLIIEPSRRSCAAGLPRTIPKLANLCERQRVADADGSGTVEHTTEVRFLGSQREVANASPIAAASALACCRLARRNGNRRSSGPLLPTAIADCVLPSLMPIASRCLPEERPRRPLTVSTHGKRDRVSVMPWAPKRNAEAFCGVVVSA